MTDAALLSVQDLSVVFGSPDKPVVAVDNVSFELRRGETLGLLGESGSGKSATAFSIVRLLPPSGRITAGRVLFEGRDLLQASDDEMRRTRGAGIGFVFQEPAAALNPVMRVGDHIGEALLAHGVVSGRRESRARAIELLGAVRMPEPEKRAHAYPHELSGGMRQRAMIAIALACRPALLIADEPTAALDVTVQAQVLDLLRDMKTGFDLSLLLITHDFGVLATTADRIAVMYTGRIVEEGTVHDIFGNPLHPYTQALLGSIPGARPSERLPAIDGSAPAPDALPPGCTFAPRCRHRMEVCTTAVPAHVEIASGRRVRCYLRSDAREPRVGATASGAGSDAGAGARS